MSYFVFLLTLLLLAGAAGGLYASIDLLPTEIGIFYASCGVFALCAALTTLSVALLIRRVDKLARLVREGQAKAEEVIANIAPPLAGQSYGEAAAMAAQVAPPPESETIGDDQQSASLAPETGSQSPGGDAALVGRYASGGANYMIFADGSIEAVTESGTQRFASMNDFKRHLAQAKH